MGNICKMSSRGTSESIGFSNRSSREILPIRAIIYSSVVVQLASKVGELVGRSLARAAYLLVQYVTANILIPHSGSIPGTKVRQQLLR
jgi:hypothetical protein